MRFLLVTLVIAFLCFYLAPIFLCWRSKDDPPDVDDVADHGA